MSLAYEGTLDTNILLRFLLKDQLSQYEKARAIVETPRIFHISNLSIAEIVFILESKGFTRHQVKLNIEVLSSYRHLYMQRGIILPALALYEAHPALSFIDACLVYEAESENATPLYTFDKKLAKQAPHTKLLA